MKRAPGFLAAIMTTVRTSSLRRKPLGIAVVAVIALLTACGEHGSAGALFGSTTADGAKESSTARCFNVVGRPSQDDADLFAAAGTGDLRRVEQSLDAGANMNATDTLKRTPLFAAAFCNQPEVASLLLDKGSDVDAKDFLGMSPLHAAVVAGWDKVAKVLISRGANVNTLTSAGLTPLHLAAATNQLAMVELLLDRGANAHLRDKEGITAASLASNNGHTKVAAAIRKWQEKQHTSMQK
jgi:ankyrin repeat protein